MKLQFALATLFLIATQNGQAGIFSKSSKDSKAECVTRASSVSSHLVIECNSGDDKACDLSKEIGEQNWNESTCNKIRQIYESRHPGKRASSDSEREPANDDVKTAQESVDDDAG